MVTNLAGRLSALDRSERAAMARTLITSEEAAYLPDEIWSVCDEFSLISAEDRARLPSDVVDAYPLTTSQLGMIAHSLADADLLSGTMPAAYHNVATLMFEFERFDEAAFRLAAELLVRRHPIFRTSFALTEYSCPLQLVHSEAHPKVTFIDLRALAPAEQEAELAKFAAKLNDEPVELGDYPLIYFYVHRLTDGKIALTLVEPHAISDGWSTHLSLVDLVTAHNATLRGESPSDQLSHPATYRHFVAQQMAENTSVVDRQFWRAFGARLALAPHRPAPPADRNAVHTAHRREVVLPEDLVIGLKALADTAGVSLKVVLLAVHLRVLAMEQGVSQPVTGMTVNGRLAVPGGVDVRGMFLNIVPFATAVDSGWRQLLRQVDETDQEVTLHRRLPLASIVKEGGAHLMPTSMFVFNHFHSMAGVAQRERLATMEDLADWSRTNYELEVSFNLSAETANRMTFLLVHDLRTIDSATAEHYFESYLAVLQEAAAAVTEGPEPSESTPAPTLAAAALVADGLSLELGSSLAAHAALVAVRSGLAELTYAELDERSAEVARHLATLGVVAGSRVGLMCAPSLEFFVGLVAILRLGAVYVPLDVAHPADRRQHIVDDAGLRVVLWDGAIDFDIRATAEPIHCSARHPRHDRIAPSRCRPDAPEPAYIIYTSGSTGRPKGVEVPVAGLRNRLAWMQADFPIGPGSSVLHKTAPSFDVSVWELVWPLLHGARVVVADHRMRQEPDHLAELIIDEEITLCHFVPSVLARFVTAPRIKECISLRQVICSGEALPPRVVNEIYELLPEVSVTNLYGPTEASIDVTGWRCRRPEPGTSVPIGTPRPQCEIHLLDEVLRPVPDGTPGELCIGGVQVANGYLNRPELSQRVFVDNPFAPGELLYRTGDLVRLRPDGAIEYLGRADRQVKLNGVRLELEEVEAVLAQHPQVSQAAAEIVEAANGSRQLVGFVIMRTGAECVPSDIIATARRSLPTEVAPARIIPVDRFPLTGSGKLDRAALRDLAGPVAVVAEPAVLSETEELVSCAWQKVTGMDTVDFEMDLYALGLDSITAVLMISRMRAEGYVTSVPELMNSASLRDYAALLDEEQ